MTLLKKLAVLALLAMPGVASAATMQFICYNAFDDTVQAFQRLALIASDPVFLMIAGCFVAGSIVMSASFFAAEGMAKKANNPFGFLIQGVMGLVMFFGAVMPKGTIYVYDEVLNKNQAVGGVPDLIVFFAGTLNAVERELTRMVDTAAATPYSNDVGAIGYQLIYNASRAKQSDADLERTIGQYVMDCGLTAIGTNQNGATMNELLRTSTDLRDTLAEYTHPSWPTTYYPANNSGGVPGTCADSWAYIKPILDNVAGGQIAALSDQVCREAGFNTSDANAAAKCDSLETEAASLFGTAPASSGVFLRNFIVAKGMMNMLMRPDFTGSQGMLVNRSMMAEGFGATEALNQWVPRLRAMMMALILGIIPIPLLFIATNLVYKSLGLVIGLLAFMALWGVTDAISVQMARDAAATAFAQIKNQHMGFEALMLAPSASLQALALYGKYRMMGMAMATVIAGALFKVSTGAFGTSAEAAGKDLEVKGSAAGTSTMTPEGMQSTMGSLTASSAAMAQVSRVGEGASMSAGAMPAMTAGAAQTSYIEGANRSGGRPGEGFDLMMGASGARTAGGIIGGNKGLLESSSDRGEDALTTATSAGRGGEVTNLGRNIGGYEGAKAVGEGRGASPSAVVSGAAAASTGFDSESALARQEGGRTLTGRQDGDLHAAHIAGTGQAASALADANAASVFKGEGETEKLGALAEARNASVRGAGVAAGGDVGHVQSKFETEQKVDFAKADTIGGEAGAVGHGQGTDAKVGAAGTNRAAAAFGVEALKSGNTLHKASEAGAGQFAAKNGGAAKVGAETGDGQARGNLVNARATKETWNALGPAAMVQGAVYGKAGEAYRGAGAAELGGGSVFPTAKETGENQVANDVAAARISGAIGKQLGLNPDHIKDRLDVSERKQGVVSMTLADGDKKPFAEAAVRSGAMTEAQAGELMAHKGAQRVDFAIDKDGNIGAPKATSSSDVASGNTVNRNTGTTDKEGDTRIRGNTVRAGDSVSVNQALSFGGSKMEDIKGASKTVQDLLGPNLNNGHLTAQVRDVIAQTYSQRAEQQGHTLSADASTAYSEQESVSGDLAMRAGKGGKYSAGGGAGASVSATSSTTDQQTNAARANAFTTGIREAIDSNWNAAGARTEAEYGKRETWDGDTAAKANSYQADQFAARNEASFQKLSGRAADSTRAGEARAQGESEIRDKVEHAKDFVKGLF